MRSKKKYRIAFLKAFSGLSINISAAFLAVAFIGPNVSFPTDLKSVAGLTFNIVFGIVFLLLTVLCEKEM